VSQQNQLSEEANQKLSKASGTRHKLSANIIPTHNRCFLATLLPGNERNHGGEADFSFFSATLCHSGVEFVVYRSFSWE
tara:strand:- start:165 stop:401 length:237 start_codon:yes stop_codon:yes gene_type:complete